MWPNLTLAQNGSRSTQGDNLNNLGSTHIHNATYQVSRSSVIWIWRRRFFKVFTIYGHGSHLGHVTRTIWTTFRSPNPWRLQMKFGYNWPSSFRGEVVWNCWRTTTDDGRRRRTTDDGACLYYKLPRSLWLRWAKKILRNYRVTWLRNNGQTKSSTAPLFQSGAIKIYIYLHRISKYIFVVLTLL